MSQEMWLLAQAGSTLPMLGLIWFVHVVHYPLMGRVGEASFGAYQAAHVQRTGWVVVPFMLLELVSAVALVATAGSVPRPEAAVGLVLLASVWGSTFFLQVPLHERLLERFDSVDHARLVRTNGLRTAFWSARGALILVWLGRALL